MVENCLYKVTKTGGEVERPDVTLDRARRCGSSRAEAKTLFGLHVLRPATIPLVARRHMRDVILTLTIHSYLTVI
jgi:hypothetical protein